MLILNFSHHLADNCQEQIEKLKGISIDEIRDIPMHINQLEPLKPQITTIVDASGLSSEEWQTLPLLINPPTRVCTRSLRATG